MSGRLPDLPPSLRPEAPGPLSPCHADDEAQYRSTLPRKAHKAAAAPGGEGPRSHPINSYGGAAMEEEDVAMEDAAPMQHDSAVAHDGGEDDGDGGPHGATLSYDDQHDDGMQVEGGPGGFHAGETAAGGAGAATAEGQEGVEADAEELALVQAAASQLLVGVAAFPLEGQEEGQQQQQVEGDQVGTGLGRRPDPSTSSPCMPLLHVLRRPRDPLSHSPRPPLPTHGLSKPAAAAGRRVR